jgi:arylsulfatase A-like enzyme/Flp pilus assembly protein TadD
VAKKKKKKKKTAQSVEPTPSLAPQPAPKKRFPYWAVLVAVLVLTATFWLVSGRGGRKLTSLCLRESPNILLISVDTLRADHVGAYGAEVKTPAIDGIAEQGVVFEKALAPVPVTLPSHTSLFTGSLPIFHGVRDNGSFRLADRHETLAESFKAAGYRTAAFIGSFALDSRFGLDQGFDTYNDFYGDTSGFSDFGISERPADEVLEPALSWLNDGGNEPWFVFVHIWDPHHPYSPPPPFRERHPGDPYTGEVAYVSDALGRLLSELEAQSKLDNTLIVFTADHGEGLGQHGETTHGMFAYESTLHVPLILHWNGVLPEGRRISSRVRLIDVAPTILELTGLNPTEAHQGESLVPLILDPSVEEGRSTYFEALAFNLNRNWAPLTGLYEGNTKYIELPLPELYDLSSDPGETQNLYEKEPDQSQRMKAALECYIDAHSTEESRVIQVTEVDPETVARLRALGYVIDAEPTREPKDYTEDDDPKRLVHLSDKLDDGVAAHAAGRSEEAIQLFREIIEERPSFANVYANLAHVLEDTGRLREAIAVLEGALENGYTTRTMMGRLGLYYQEAGDLEKSVSILETVIENDPTYVEAYNYLSVSYARLGRTREAIETNEKLLELDKSYASAYNNLGSIYLGVGQLEEAESNLRRALELDPSLADAWNGLGVVHARMGRQSEAITAWIRSVELNPRQFDTLYNLGTLLTQLNLFEEAIPYLEQFVRTAPKDRYGADIPKVQFLIDQLRAAGNRQ